jgi:hypothetical protein
MVSKPRRAGSLGLCIDWHRKSDAALTGDIAFAPEEVSKTTWVQGLKEGTQIRYRFGIGAEGLKTRNI